MVFQNELHFSLSDLENWGYSDS